MDAVLALMLYRRRRFDEAIVKCDDLLVHHPNDQVAWLIKARSLIGQNWIDDTDVDEQDLSDLLLDVGKKIAESAKPKTSMPSAAEVRPDLRPSTRSGRPSTGVLRQSNRLVEDDASGSGASPFRSQGDRPVTSRPVTQSGRFVRLNTASLASTSSTMFIDLSRIDLRRYATQKPVLARALCEYSLQVLRAPKEAFDLARFATESEQFSDWWWQRMLGRSYYQMGLFDDAERQFRASIRNQDMVVTQLELAKVLLRKEQFHAALETYSRGSHAHQVDPHLLVGKARAYEGIGNVEEAIRWYQKALELDASNVEAIACLAQKEFYEGNPEVALRLYRRLLQMGVQNATIWANLGLCCFYAGQYDVVLSSFRKALVLVEDDHVAADVWYNIGHLAIGIGDLDLAYQSFRISVNLDPHHAESLNCLGVLDLKRMNGPPGIRKARLRSAISMFTRAIQYGGQMYEPRFNLAICYHTKGDLRKCYETVLSVLEVAPGHPPAMELKLNLEEKFF